MQRLIAFWRHDRLNKLIALAALGIILALATLAGLALFMPEGKSIGGALAAVLPARPSPTATPSATPVTPQPQPTATRTFPTLPPATLTPTATATAFIPTATPPPPTPSPTPIPSDPAACLAGAPEEVGVVVDIVDGATVRVLIDGLVYTVGYLGVALPEGDAAALAAAAARNAELVFGLEVRLFAGTAERDLSGRVMRYVVAGEAFVNYALIAEGVAEASAFGAQEVGLAGMGEFGQIEACWEVFRAAGEN